MRLKGGVDSGGRAEAAARLLKIDPDSKSVTDERSPRPLGHSRSGASSCTRSGRGECGAAVTSAAFVPFGTVPSASRCTSHRAREPENLTGKEVVAAMPPPAECPLEAALQPMAGALYKMPAEPFDRSLRSPFVTAWRSNPTLIHWVCHVAHCGALSPRRSAKRFST